jgi:hypothetical protein
MNALTRLWAFPIDRNQGVLYIRFLFVALPGTGFRPDSFSSEGKA